MHLFKTSPPPLLKRRVPHRCERRASPLTQDLVVGKAHDVHGLHGLLEVVLVLLARDGDVSVGQEAVAVEAVQQQVGCMCTGGEDTEIPFRVAHGCGGSFTQMLKGFGGGERRLFWRAGLDYFPLVETVQIRFNSNIFG